MGPGGAKMGQDGAKMTPKWISRKPRKTGSGHTPVLDPKIASKICPRTAQNRIQFWISFWTNFGVAFNIILGVIWAARPAQEASRGA